MKKNWDFQRIISGCLAAVLSVTLLSGCSELVSGVKSEEKEQRGKHKKEYSSTDIYEKYETVVGEIVTYDRKGAELALGTGFMIESGDQVITNYHVIEDAYDAQITFGEDVYEVLGVVAYDVTIDVAVLQIDEERDASVKVCNDEHDVGVAVYALGNSKGMTSTFSDGMITAATREIDGVKYVQHDAPISSGNSGGPLINAFNEIIGINTWTVRDSQNLNFAIHMSELDNLVYGDAITLAELCKAEGDPYETLVQHVMDNGSHSDGSYYLDLGEDTIDGGRVYWWASYDTGDECVSLWYTFEDSFDGSVVVDVDKDLSGNYEWAYLDDYDQYMKGTVNAGTFNENSTLSYDYKDLASGVSASSVQSLATTMLVGLCLVLDDSLAEINVTAYDLGFVNF